MSGPAVRKRANYKTESGRVFTKDFVITPETPCPDTAIDEKTGETGDLVPGSCITVNDKSGGKCFIATAAYGSELDPHVELLREFRDDVLLKSDLRGAFEKVLSAYYRYSPPVAEAMRRNRSAKLVIKWALVYPVFIFIKSFVRILKIRLTA